MIEALKKLENKFSHKSWQFRCSKWVFRHLLYDHLSAWQTVAWTLFSSLSHCLCLSLQNWFAHLEVGQLDFGRLSALSGLVTLVKDLESDSWRRGGILPFALYSSCWQCFEMSWAFTIEQNEVPFPLRDRILCHQSQILWLQGQSMPGSRFGRT